MSELSTIARPYAKAIFYIAKLNNINDWHNFIMELSYVLSFPEVLSIILMLRRDVRYKVNLLLSLMESSLKNDKNAKKLIEILITNNRLSIISKIFMQFKIITEDYFNKLNITIFTAFPLNKEEIDDLVMTLEKKINKKLYYTIMLDPKLIGGVRIKVRDMIIDYSIRGQLDNILESLIS